MFDLDWAPAATINVFSDASSIGCGAHVTVDNHLHIAHRRWLDTERSQSSTWRELETVRFCLSSFAPLLRHRIIQWNTDNQAVPTIILKGSPKLCLQKLAMSLFDQCLQSNIALEPVWIPRLENEMADHISRISDFDDWAVQQALFASLDYRFGPFTCDCFADERNKKVDKFYSRYWRPGCFGVNAFAQDWSGDNNWIVPPVSQAGKAIQHLIRCKAKGTLVVPKWPSQSFWPLLFQHKEPGNQFLLRVFELPRGSPVFRAGTQIQSIFSRDVFPSPVLVVLLDASGYA